MLEQVLKHFSVHNIGFDYPAEWLEKSLWKEKIKSFIPIIGLFQRSVDYLVVLEEPKTGINIELTEYVYGFLEEFVNNTIQHYLKDSRISDITPKEKVNITGLGDLDAFKFSFTLNLGHEIIKCDNLLFQRYPWIYQMKACSLASNYDRNKKIFDELFNSLVIE